MKLASFHAAGTERYGVLVGNELVDLATTRTAVPDGAAPPRNLLELIEAGAAGLDWARAAAGAAERGAGERYALPAVQWRPPVRRPSKICCIALNNSANSERIIQGPKTPAMFIKPSSALLGHLGAIECRPAYGRTHPEPELALVISRTAKNIAAEAAYAHVFGYTIHNDITSPTMRSEDTFHYRAIHPRAGDPGQVEHVDTWVSYPGRYKCSDTFACMGPWLVTSDEIPDPHDLEVSCSHQGALITQDNTRNLLNKIPELLAFLSSYLTLLPGDIVSLGTALKQSAAGGAIQNVDLNRLGGPVSVTIERLGTLTNTVCWV
jgi:2-keto-4-pentenoate hydratase/2-oxohepta-3-ene-1,7-dioic acid hydratase in catechol pathway